MIRKLWKFHGGVHPNDHKLETAEIPPKVAKLPECLILPLHQHIGEPASPLVKVGDKVLKGQMLAEANGFVSAPIHAPTSGTIIDISEQPIPHPSGLSALCAVLETDGMDQWCELTPIDDYTELSAGTIRNIVREAGIVGLGGAGFPSFIKLNPGPGNNAIDTLVLNGVECEPYISCDDTLMRERPEEILKGLKIIRYALQAKECIIAIEDNKPEAIYSMQQMCADEEGISVVAVPTLYPQGGEKQLVKVLTGKEVPSNGLVLNIGVVCVNVSTTASVYRAVTLGEPLISRIVTITGTAISTPRNMEVLIGTPIRELIEQCHGRTDQIKRLVMGGPMMGYALHSADLPAIKTTNCVLAMADHDLPAQKPVMPCIRCGACMDSCPINLMPQQLYWYAKSSDIERVQDFHLFDCIECGCCSYVCPSNIPLVQYFRHAKGEIWLQEREQQKADIARERFENRLERQENEKREREEKRKKKAEALKNRPAKKAGSAAGKSQDAKKAAIKAAMARVKEKKQQAQDKREQMEAFGAEQKAKHEEKRQAPDDKQADQSTATPDKQD